MAKRTKTPSTLHPIQTYASDIHARYKDGSNATEHTYRSSLQILIESLHTKTMATNEPQRIECGAPDFIITTGNIPVGYIEAKDLGKDLDIEEESEQLQRYFNSLDSIILTNYLEFRWYVKGKLRLKCSIGKFSKKKIEINEKGFKDLEQLIEVFCSAKIPVIKTAQELAERLAGSTKNINQLILKSYALEPETGYLHKWLSAFKSVLIADLDVDRFADMFAQTLVYGFFSARAHQKNEEAFARDSASRVLPETNPFLRRLFHEFAGLDMPMSIDWAVDEVVEILKRTDTPTVLKDFGKKGDKDDPIFHFYETFLEKYDPELKDALGAYYTPNSVINYIVTSVDKILKNHFNRDQGLADENTLILDPATGTGSFLFHAIQTIRKSLKGQEGTWPQYVSEKLLGRIFGFEIMMAPYSVAHLKIGNQLKESGYKFNSGKRLGIYLTNTLDEAAKKTDTLFAEFVSNEANEAAAIKSDKPIVAIMGNPPYKQYAENHGKWIQELMEDYKEGLGEKKNNGDNDYMKFMRFAQWRIDRTTHGVASFITPNSFLDAITLRKMRQSLLNSYSEIYVLNLHGSAMIENKEAKTKKDKNVFDIRQGVAISIFVKKQQSANQPTQPCKVFYSEIIGPRNKKYDFLNTHDIESTTWTEIFPTQQRNFFRPGSLDINENYQSFVSVRDIFPLSTSGIQPKKKDIAIQFSQDEMTKVINDLAILEEAEFRTEYGVSEDSKGWKVSWAQAHAKELIKNKKALPTKIQYRTFDYRWTVIDDYSSGIVGRPRYDVMKHFARPKNIGMILLRQLSQSDFQHAWVTRCPIDENTISRKTREYNYVFPLYLQPDPDQLTGYQPHLNISDKARSLILENFGLVLTNGIPGDFETTIGPEQFFHYIYGVLHSPQYRSQFYSELKIDFPRIPFFKDKQVVKALSEAGQELSSLHLMEHSVQATPEVGFPNQGSNLVSELKFDTENNAISINENQIFTNIQKENWTFKVGGHEVLKEFFSDRIGKVLTSDEVATVRKIAVAAKRTPVIMGNIDNVIQNAGGWPSHESLDQESLKKIG